MYCVFNTKSWSIWTWLVLILGTFLASTLLNCFVLNLLCSKTKQLKSVLDRKLPNIKLYSDDFAFQAKVQESLICKETCSSLKDHLIFGSRWAFSVVGSRDEWKKMVSSDGNSSFFNQEKGRERERAEHPFYAKQ